MFLFHSFIGNDGFCGSPITDARAGDYAMLMKMFIELMDGNKVLLSEYAVGFRFGYISIQQGVEAYLFPIAG